MTLFAAIFLLEFKLQFVHSIPDKLKLELQQE